jgi:hypothetical protein
VEAEAMKSLAMRRALASLLADKLETPGALAFLPAEVK